MKIITIARNPENSPNMADNDAAILKSVVDELVGMGVEVIAINESDDIPNDTDIVCHMSRSNAVLQKLTTAEERGIAVMNTPESVRNCSRINFMQILERNGIPQPLFCTIGTENDLKHLPYPAWIKRGEGWSCHKNDVCFVTDSKEAIEAANRMRERGIECLVYTPHCKGDIVKFYGVGNSYFTYNYPNAEKSKFGLEKINGEIKHYPFDADILQRMASDAAKAVGLSIYGGDCIIGENGDILLIDLNDFPSFSSVRKEAAKKIAESIMNLKI